MNVTATKPPPGPDKVILTPSNIAITDKVQFEVGKADLKPVSYPLLDEVVTVMKGNPQIELVEIGGHTDSTGTAQYNQTLSEKRAQAVADYLIKAGLPAERFSAVGYGSTQPIAGNDTDQGKAQNRRIDFVVK